MFKSDLLASSQDLLIAKQLLALENLPQAEFYLRRHMANNGETDENRLLLATLKVRYGFPTDFRLSENNIGDFFNRKFLIIKAWGYGFWSEAHHLASQLLLAELTKRTAIVLWGENCLFRATHSINSFEEFFQPISDTCIEDIPQTASFFPPKWHLGNLTEENINKWEGKYSRIAAQHLLNRPEDVVVCDFFSTLDSITPWIASDSIYFGQSTDQLCSILFQRYLLPATSVATSADEFFFKHMQDRNWMAVHMRGSDKVHEAPDLDRINGEYFAYIDRIIDLNPDIGIFLLTDFTPIRENFLHKYPGRVLSTQATRTSNVVGVHLSGHDGLALGREVFIDVLLALRCNYFIGNQESNVSLAIQSMGKWNPGFLFMLGNRSVRESNLFLHARPEPTPPRCRLCEAQTKHEFLRTLLGKHSVEFYKCLGCGSLQTEQPYWLGEAYTEGAEQFDTAKGSRTLSHFFVLPRLLEILGITQGDRCVDFGRKTGLFSRLMRDIGFNYFDHDIYGRSEFCTAFHWPGFDHSAKLITLFEGAEHFSNPSLEWKKILASNPDFIIGSTELYSNQNSEWEFLLPESGQNIFFHSSQALSFVANKYGMSAYLVGKYFIFCRAPLSHEVLKEIQAFNGNLDGACHDTFKKWITNPYETASLDSKKLIARSLNSSSKQCIVLDGVFFRFASGISRLWKSLLSEWSVNGFGEFFVIIDRENTAPRFPGLRYVNARHHDYTNRSADRDLLQQICDQENAVLFISTYYTTPTHTPSVMLIPDMIPEVMNFDLCSEQWVEKHEAIRFSKHFLTISQSTARDLRKFFPEIESSEVIVAHCGSDFRTSSKEYIESFKLRYGIDRPYFIISGTKNGYKNALLFFQAFAKLGDDRKKYGIMCTNSGPTLENEFSECIGDAKLHLLILSDQDLQAAYSGALALAYPSRYEGFGLPLLEAMTCSCPVITCNNSSIYEVAGDAAIYVDADNAHEMLSALHAVQQADTRRDLIFRGQLRARFFSWRKMADAVETALMRWAQYSKNSPTTS